MRFHLRAPSLSSVITFLVVSASSAFVFWQLNPRLLLMDSLTAGGDMGAHVWLPSYVKEHLLPHGRVTGWTPDWYAGFPALTFYFPLPALLIVGLSYLMPYAIAFKLVTVSGVVSMPIAGWAFGRLAKLPFPVPACLAAAIVPFLFDTGYTILGGNIASTLAGEFSFSIGLSMAIVFLGLVAGGLDSNKRRGWAALLFGLIILTHILPTIFALTGGLLLMVMRLVAGGRIPGHSNLAFDREKAQRQRGIVRSIVAAGVSASVVCALIGVFAIFKGEPNGYFFAAVTLFALTALFVVFAAPTTLRELKKAQRPVVFSEAAVRWAAIKWAVVVGAVGGLVSAFWALPFVWNSNFMNDMGWEKIGVGKEAGMQLYNQKVVHYSDGLFPNDLAVILFAGYIGAAVALFMRRRIAIFWIFIALIAAVGFILMPQGRLWNARLLPFYYLSLYMLAGFLISEIGWGVANFVKRLRGGNEYAEGFQVAAPLLALALAGAVVMPKLPAPEWWPWENSTPWHSGDSSSQSFIPSWAKWNYAGYDGKDSNGAYYKAAYPEYQSVVQMMEDIGHQRGCGRVMWEYEPTLDRFGTPMALMLLPMHTKGCMGSMEGLFFESSATVPYHFLNQALLSKTPSSAMRDLPYGTLDVAAGVSRLQMLGAKYYLAISPEAQQQAALDPRLTIAGQVPAAPDKDGHTRSWIAYEIADTDLVAPLQNLPAVITDPKSIATRRDGGDPSTEKLSKREAWLENAIAWYNDPSRATTPLAADGPKDWPRIQNATETAPAVPVTDPARISRISTSTDRIAFRVENPGSPVVVRTSYFPNWKVDGAKDIYRLTPNLMVLTPTKNEVELKYGYTPVDGIGLAATIIGLFGVGLLMRRDRLTPEVVSEAASADDASEGPKLVTVASSADPENAEVLEIYTPPEEPKPS